jgi:flagellar basal body rod protein FlgF
MDRLAQTALSAIRQMKDTKFDLAHNLSNVNVPGFSKRLAE